LRALTAAGILLLIIAVLLVSFFQIVDDSLPSLVVLISLVVFCLAGLSFGVSRINPKHGYAIAAILVLIGAVVVTGPVLYAETHSVVGCLGPCGDNGGTPIISGTIIVTPGSHNGTLTLELGTIGTNSPFITNITIGSTLSDYGRMLSNVSGFEFMYQGQPVSATNRLPWNQTASGSIEVTNVIVGAAYDIACYWHLSNDESHFDVAEFGVTASG
jgi:hypothetical protein